MAIWRRKSPAPPRSGYLTVESVVLGEDVRVEELVEAVGESFYQPAISSICGRQGVEAVAFDCIAALVPQPYNSYDPNAISVQVNAQIVGHLSRKDAIRYHALTDAAERLGVVIACNARIGARDPQTAETTNAGVFLHLPAPVDAAAELAEWSREKLGDGRVEA